MDLGKYLVERIERRFRNEGAEVLRGILLQELGKLELMEEEVDYKLLRELDGERTTGNPKGTATRLRNCLYTFAADRGMLGSIMETRNWHALALYKDSARNDFVLHRDIDRKVMGVKSRELLESYLIHKGLLDVDRTENQKP